MANNSQIVSRKFPDFDREFFSSSENFTMIGSGEIGGKASGLVFIHDFLEDKLDKSKYPNIELKIPKTTVIGTNIFDRFIARNNLNELAYSNEADIRKIFGFRDASLPTEILGDLRSIVEEVHLPLAVRSSSLLEDAKNEPFAGIYATKMIPNNQASPDVRFKELCDAIKFVYASTFFKAARDYMSATKYDLQQEKMAVIIQEVMGKKINGKFYPVISGVARTFNYYPQGKSKPEDGVLSLALGLGKQIVDGGKCWTYSPKYPKAIPPFADPKDILKNTQTEFWSVNMGSIAKYSPTSEAQFLTYDNITEAEENKSLKHIASTFSSESGRLVMGTGHKGPRVLDFAPLRVLNEFKFNNFLNDVLEVSETACKNAVEIEFAVNFDNDSKLQFGFLQVRPMVISDEDVRIDEELMRAENTIAASESVLGNGSIDFIQDIIFVKPEIFETKFTKDIAVEIEKLNTKLRETGKQYLLIGFGRWGSSDPWLGIPVEWGQIASAKVIVESTLPGVNVELSQGSHFFHNLTSFQVGYFSLHHEGQYKINWGWLNEQEVVTELPYSKHVKTKRPLEIKIDGRKGRGVILA